MSHAADADRQGDRSRRRGAVRREIRRRGARAGDGRRSTSGESPIRSSCAAARMCAAWAISACSRFCRESAVAAGVRRIEALTSEGARRYLVEPGGARARSGRGAEDQRRPNCRARVAALVEERRRLERELADAKKALALAGPAQGERERPREERSPASRPCCASSKASRRRISKAWPTTRKAKLGSGVVAFVAVGDGKASLVVGVTPDLTARISAVDLVRARRRGARRQGRRRPARHGAGRRPGCTRAPEARCQHRAAAGGA